MTVFLTTNSVPVERRSAYWEEMVSTEFVSARCVTGPESTFHAQVRSVEVGNLKFYDVAATPSTTLTRTGNDIGDEDSNYFFLGIQTQGVGCVEQAGRSVLLLKGDMAMYDTSIPFRLKFDAPHRLFVVRIPAEEVQAQLSGLGMVAGMAIPRQLGAAQLLSHMVATLVNLNVRPSLRAQSSLSTAFSDLLLDAVLEARGEMRRSATVRLADAKRVAQTNLSDPDFTTKAWAARLGISERYLRVLFSGSPESPAKFLWKQRLETAAWKLRDPRYRDVSITDIAIACGFSDSAHFSRSFRASFGASPRERRSVVENLSPDDPPTSPPRV